MIWSLFLSTLVSEKLKRYFDIAVHPHERRQKDLRVAEMNRKFMMEYHALLQTLKLRASSNIFTPQDMSENLFYLVSKADKNVSKNVHNVNLTLKGQPHFGAKL